MNERVTIQERVTMQELGAMADTIVYRQGLYLEERLADSILTVLANCGDKFTKVECVNGEWSGIKDNLRGMSRVPTCPAGHVMKESDGGKVLGWVDA